MKFGFYTLGCKVNLFETQALMQQARANGHDICSKDADVFVINTCSVTAISDRKNIRAFHKIRRENPKALLVACGCFAQTEPDKLEASGEIDLICGTASRGEIIALCEQAVQGNREIDLAKFRTLDRTYEVLPAGVPEGRTRALLKIEDGCDQYCTYCIIPYARGHVRSMPPALVIEEAVRLAQANVQEIVLTGIEISSYGRDLPEQTNFTTLIAMLCEAVPNTYIRLGSLEPRTIDAEFCSRLQQYQNLRPHFHLSLQSGCDRILARMKRRYTAAFFAERCEMLRQSFPDCSITTDLIVGFPGETDTDFAQTLEFIRICDFSDIHVFPYSMRSGTPAADMPDQVPLAVKNHRAEQVKMIAAQMSKRYREKFVGRTLEVLFEHADGETWSGHSAYCFPVTAAGQQIQKNKFCQVQITAVTDTGVSGHL